MKEKIYIQCKPGNEKGELKSVKELLKNEDLKDRQVEESCWSGAT